MTVPKETLIRDYIAGLLIEKIDVGGRVFTNRKSTLFKEELPAISVEYGVDNYEIAAGDKYKPTLYDHKLNISVVTMVEEIPIAGTDPLHNSEAMDQLDKHGQKIRDTFGHDWRLARMLTDFDANTNYEGLANGLHLLGGATYDVDAGSERKVTAREIGVVILWTDDAFPEMRFSPFSEYRFSINGIESGGDVEADDE